MDLILALLAGATVGAAIAAMALRDVVHCVLFLTISLVGLALLYLKLGAEFVGFVQMLVYVGAVAILVVFAVLLTRGGNAPTERIANAPWSGVLVAAAVFAMLARAILRSPTLDALPLDTPVPTLSVKAIGDGLTGEYVLPLQIVALLLTAAMVGGVVIAMREKEDA